MKGGLRYVRHSHNLKAVTLLGFIGAFLGLPLLTFLPVITKDVFQQDVGFYSRLMTFSGAGAVTGALVVAYIGKHRHIGRLMLIFLGAVRRGDGGVLAVADAGAERGDPASSPARCS